MGGLGSGRRWHMASKDVTSDFRQIDVRRWQWDGLLRPGQSFGWQWTQNGVVQASIRIRAEADRVILCYRHKTGGADWKDEEYSVHLTWTECALGGRRPWFLCPAKGCGRRVAILYCGGIFACRHCYRLAYPSQRETAEDRAVRRADRIRERLGWEPGIANGTGGKPKGMHWCTFSRLQAEYDRLVRTWLAVSMVRFGLLQGQIEKMMDRLPE